MKAASARSGCWHRSSYHRGSTDHDEDADMPPDDLAILAEGDLPTGEHWILRAGGTPEDFYTMLETVHPDGHRDEGGMGGPPLEPGSLMNTYTGGSDQGLRRVVVRASPQVRIVRVGLASGEPIDLSPLAADPQSGLSFFATLLQPDLGLVSVTAFNADGHVLHTEDLGRHEDAWRRFLGRQHGEG
jgi:hypothetical protein